MSKTLILKHPKNGEDYDLYNYIDFEKDLAPIERVDDEGNTNIIGYVLRRNGAWKLIDGLKIPVSYSPIVELPSGIIVLMAYHANIRTYSGVCDKNLKSIGAKYPIETLQYRAEQRLVIRYLGLYKHGFVGQDEADEYKQVTKDQAAKDKEANSASKSEANNKPCALMTPAVELQPEKKKRGRPKKDKSLKSSPKKVKAIKKSSIVYRCSQCNTEVTKDLFKGTLEKFKKALCENCQK